MMVSNDVVTVSYFVKENRCVDKYDFKEIENKS